MVDGRINKFYKENVLLEQVFVKDPSKLVKDLISEKSNSSNLNLSVSNFLDFKLAKNKQIDISSNSNLNKIKFNRVLLKIVVKFLLEISHLELILIQPLKLLKIKILHDKNIEIGIVIGGGNIFRGISVSAKGMDRVAADYLGMMATIMNSVALQSELEKNGCTTRVMSVI